MAQNNFVGLITRSYEQFVNGIIERLPTAVPEITDYSTSNPFIVLINIWGGILDYISYTLDRIAENTFLSTARRFDVAVRHAKQSDYRVKGFVPATVDVLFELDGAATADVNIPSGTEISSLKGIRFFTVSNATILTGQTNVTVGAAQLETIPSIQLGTSNGNANQTFVIPDTGIADSIISQQVGGTNWQAVDTFAYSTPTDTHYKAELNEDQEFTIVFGDGINGAIPPLGDSIDTIYGVTQGAEGNLPANEINQIIDNIPVSGGLQLSVNNPLAASGGTNADTLESLKVKIPAHRATLERAVTAQDYQDIAIQVAGVAKAGAGKVDCNKVNLYIVPIGGGIASSVLLNSVETFIDPKRIIGIDVNALSAGQLRVKVNIDLRVNENARRIETRDRVIANLIEFGDPLNQEVRGGIRIGDVYEVIENTEGVKNNEIIEFSAIPYGVPINHETQLNWNRNLTEGSTSQQNWLIQMTTATEFVVFRDNLFLGEFTVGNELIFDEIVFTITSGSYVAGMNWSFITYPFNTSIDIAEDSIPTVLAQDIFFNSITGGTA